MTHTDPPPAMHPNIRDWLTLRGITEPTAAMVEAAPHLTRILINWQADVLVRRWEREQRELEKAS